MRHYGSLGSPVVRKATPLIELPEARVSRSLSGVAMPLAEADWMR
jgi:hypothetical protein